MSLNFIILKKKDNFLRMKKYLRKIFNKIAENNLVYRLAARLAYDHRGENNADIDTNGERKALEKFINRSHVIFDVGANEGDWTKTVLSMRPDVAIHCFEPSRRSFDKLTANHFPSNVVLNNTGIGSKKEEKEFYIYGDSSTANSLFLRRHTALECDGKEKVMIDTIDDYCRRGNIPKIDFLKIDVEGYELEAVKGAKKLFQEGNIAVAQIEYGGTYIDAGISLKDIFDFFGDLDYKLYKILPNSIMLIEKYKSDLENFQYANYLAVKNNFIEKI